MNAKITINDVEKEITITDEQAKDFGFNISKIWEPKKGDRYFFIGDDGGIYGDIWDDCAGVDIFRWETGNCYQTESECEFKIEKAKVETELQRFADEHNKPIFYSDTKQAKYYICWAVEIEKIAFNTIMSLKHNDIFFSSGEIAEAAVKAVGEDRVKKYYLEVE